MLKCSEFSSRFFSSRHLLIQSQLWKHQKNVWNMFKVNNKDTRTTSLKSFWCLYCQLWTNFTHCSGVSIADFEKVNLGWVEAFRAVQRHSVNVNVYFYFESFSYFRLLLFRIKSQPGVAYKSIFYKKACNVVF